MTAMPRRLRFAGSFFPGDAWALSSGVDEAVAGAEGLTAGAMPRAVVAAHAGYVYSGRLAGLSHGVVPQRPGRAVVLSPSHRHAFRGIAFPSQPAFVTPLGEVPIDREACAALASAGLARELDAAHDDEHGIETQLPFLARRWPGLPVVPLVIGAETPATVATTIDALDDGATLFVLSSDLSHFSTDANARRIDAETAALIERGKAEGLDGDHACGWQAVGGWLTSRAGAGTRALRLGMGNSGDVSGDRAMVVGYGAWAFYDLDADCLAEGHRARLLGAARAAIAGRLAGERATLPEVPEPLQTTAACFVTLTESGALRGCVGALEARGPLVEAVTDAALGAAFRDPRFPPVRPGELDRLRIEISVLTRAAPMAVGSEAEALAQIRPGHDGLIIEDGGRQATFLPAVWDSLPDPRDFLSELRRKAGLGTDHWSETTTLSRYWTEEFGEA